MGLPVWSRAEKTVHGIEKHWLSGKEEFLGAMVNKEDHADSVLRHKRIHHSLKKSATLNSASYCQLLRQYFTLFIVLENGVYSFYQILLKRQSYGTSLFFFLVWNSRIL